MADNISFTPEQLKANFHYFGIPKNTPVDTCVCGCQVNARYMQTHLVSRRHLKRMCIHTDIMKYDSHVITCTCGDEIPLVYLYFHLGSRSHIDFINGIKPSIDIGTKPKTRRRSDRDLHKASCRCGCILAVTSLESHVHTTLHRNRMLSLQQGGKLVHPIDVDENLYYKFK